MQFTFRSRLLLQKLSLKQQKMFRTINNCLLLKKLIMKRSSMDKIALGYTL